MVTNKPVNLSTLISHALTETIYVIISWIAYRHTLGVFTERQNQSNYY